jgi:hypothetical protein
LFAGDIDDADAWRGNNRRDSGVKRELRAAGREVVLLR